MSGLLRIAAAIALVAQPCSAALPPVAPPPAVSTQEQVHAACVASSARPRPAVARSIVQAAEQEWARYGGRSFTFGDEKYQFRTVEADWVELQGARFERTEDAFTWGRVYSYWRSVGAAGLLDMAYGVRLGVDGKPIRDSEGEVRHNSVNLNVILNGLAAVKGFDANQREALRIAAVRASLIEQPWSAVFISTMMKVAGLTALEFPQVANHSGYIRAAVDRGRVGTGAIRYTACPPAADVAVKPGDLICNARGQTPKGFGTVWNAQGGFDAHCDIVVSVDSTSLGFQIRSIGGNVQDTVLRTQYRGSGTPALENVAGDKKWLAVLVLG